MTGNYDIQAGDGGTFIVRKYGTEWVRIATFIPGEYTEADEALLGNADTLADALEQLVHSLFLEDPSISGPAVDNARTALRDAGRGHLLP